MWVPDFSPEHYNKMLYTKRASPSGSAPTCTGPDGKPGIDISGYTMKNMYEEMSKGAYTVDGAGDPVGHGAALRGVVRRRPLLPGRDGVWVAGASRPCSGHPDNPLGAGPARRSTRSTRSPRRDPNFPWADYDIEDQGDRDGDGNFYEPDGVIDHLVLVHAGEDKSGGGGAEGAYAIWAHSSRGRRRLHHPGHRPQGRRTTSCSPRTPASACSPTSTATTSACRTCTTPPAPATPTSTSGT